MPGRRPLFVFVALLSLPLSACLHISATVGPDAHQETPKAVAKKSDAPQSRQTEFKTLPSIPGTVVRVQNPNTQSNTSTAQKSNPPQVSPSPIKNAGSN